MALSSLPAPVNIIPYQSNNQPFKTSTTQIAAGFAQTFVDITTSEGDKVTLQHSTSHMTLSQDVQWQNNKSQGMTLTSRSLADKSFSYTVQGDLNDQELKDIGELFDALSFIADDFYQGHLDDAMAGALNIGDLGSLSSLVATFSKTEISAGQITNQHPYAMADLAGADNEEQAIARHRQAQWQQILSYLEKKTTKVDQSAKKDDLYAKEYGQEMMTKIDRIIERHQRLESLITNLVKKAITDQQPTPKNNNPNYDHQTLLTNRKHGYENVAAGTQQA